MGLFILFCGFTPSVHKQIQEHCYPQRTGVDERSFQDHSLEQSRHNPKTEGKLQIFAFLAGGL